MKTNTKFINLTPHSITLMGDGKVIRDFPPSGKVARVSSNVELMDPIDGVPTVRTSHGRVEDLPIPINGVVYIVSSLVLSCILGRNDVISPDTGPQSVVRNAKGHVIGVNRFQRSIK